MARPVRPAPPAAGGGPRRRRGGGTRSGPKNRRCRPTWVHPRGTGPPGPPVGPAGNGLPAPHGPGAPRRPGCPSGPSGNADAGWLTPGGRGGRRPTAPLMESAQRPRSARPVPPGSAPAAPGAGGLYQQGAPQHRHATPGGGLCHHAPGNRDCHPGADDARGRGAPGPGVHPLLQQPAGADGSHLHLERGRPPHRGQQQVRGRARGAQLHGNRPQKGRGPGNPNGWGRPHPHQRPRTTGRLLPVGGTGGVLGRHTNVCHGAQPWWETPVVIAGNTNVYMDATSNPARSSSARAGRPAVSEGPWQAARRT